MLRVLNVLDAVDRGISKTVRLICTVSLMIIFVLFIANVFLRFVPIYNFTTTDEWTQLFLLWTIFFGAQEMVRTRGHFAVDVFTEHLIGTWIGRVLEIIVAVISLITYLTIFWFGVVLVMRSQASMQTIPYMKVAYFYACIPLSAFFMTIYAARDLLAVLTRGSSNRAAA